jgi:hypothetical protein
MEHEFAREIEAMISSLNFLLRVLLLFLFITLICKDKLWKKVILTVLLPTLALLAELTTFSLFHFISEPSFYDEYDSRGVFGPLVTTIFIVFYQTIFIMLWKLYISKIHISLVNFGLFLLLPISQTLIIIGVMIISIEHGFNLSILITMGAVLGFFADLVLLRILFANAEKTVLELRLMELEHLRTLEKARFESIEARQHEISKIKHDFNNQLVVAYRLIQQSKHEEATEMLDAISAALQEANDKTYCENHVVNAILVEKQTTCMENGISLKTDLILAEDCGVLPLHLCSIFSNMIDNAITACQDIADSVIFVTTVYKGDYLHIKCVNPVINEERNSKQGGGYGTRILTDIAEQYDGAYNVEKSDMQYSAVVSLMCRSSKGR